MQNTDGDENIFRNKNSIKKKTKIFNLNDEEKDLFLKLLKKWLTKYNSFITNTGASSEDLLDKNNHNNSVHSQNISSKTAFINRIKVKFTRVKILIDFLELSINCSKVSEILITDFSKFSKVIRSLIYKILRSSNKIKNDTVIFNEIMLLNYPFIMPKINFNNFQYITNIDDKKGGIVAFNKAYVIKVKPPTILLWSKKIFYNCNCKTEEKFFNKYFDVYRINEKSFNYLNESYCSICKTEYIHDKNSDIFIDVQEATLIIEFEENCLINNVIEIWIYGDLINSIQEQEIVSFVAFYSPCDSRNNYEKDFEFGKFVALNFNKYFEPFSILNSKKISVKLQEPILDNILPKKIQLSEEFSSKYYKQEYEILRSVKFQKQLHININKFLINLFINNYKSGILKKRRNADNKSNLTLETCPFLCFALDLSIVQRDFNNKLKKSSFFNEDKDILITTENKSTNKYTTNCIENSLTQSRNILFKSKIFENKKQVNTGITNYFRLARQTGFPKYMQDGNNYLSRQLNLFFIFDNLSLLHNDFIRIIYNYAECYTFITFYPFFNSNNNKFNKDCFIKYISTCKNGIIIIPDVDLLSSKEIELLASIMNDSNMNISFWILCSHYKFSHGKKGSRCGDFNNKKSIYQSLIDKCEILLNLSKLNRSSDMSTNTTNFNASKNSDIVFGFSNSSDGNINLDILEKLNNCKILNFIENEMCKENHSYDKRNNPEEDFNDPFSAAKLMEDYFIIKRNLSNIQFDDFFLLLRISTFVSILRCNYENKKIIFPKTIENINFLDVVLTIFFFEEYVVFKYGLECSSFGNIIPKIFNYNFSDDFVFSINEFKKLKIEEVKTPIPKTRNSLRKIFIKDETGENRNLNQKQFNCKFCHNFSKMGPIEKIEEFLEKLTIFTYNN